MPVRDDPEVVGRLQRALEAFQKAQGLLLTQIIHEKLRQGLKLLV